MINEKELLATQLSPTKRDFYQIWNELLETAGKISERWDPTSTNESDPGIVLLKVLTACADKLNYTIDKNILEAFMPSAAQEESMRKLCSMMGYDVKYYRSATTEALISFRATEDISKADFTEESAICFPRFTNLKTIDEALNYVTLEPVYFGGDELYSKSVPCIEGTLETCGTNQGEVIKLNDLDDNNKYYLPETQIAENGIFINYAIPNLVTNQEFEQYLDGDAWDRVANLNTEGLGSTCFKFGFDSAKGLPYVQFPEDIGALIGDGLFIRYLRTSGINGNISAFTLSSIETPVTWSTETTTEAGTTPPILQDMELFSVTNLSAATNGANKESLTQAYNNFKKTVGTFNTLVTCRDYINKIYQLTISETDTTPLVSNVIVSDIRDDINNAITICTFGDSGIYYIDRAVNKSNGIAGTEAEKAINNFNLVLYPFKTYTPGDVSGAAYVNSFKYSAVNNGLIFTDLEANKTISHTFVTPEVSDIACIKNYLRLSAKITTTYKVTASEEKAILDNIKLAIYNTFNARQVDFGESIPFDFILECIQKADTRIKNVSLDEPVLATAICPVEGEEIWLADTSDKKSEGYRNKLALRNILAGRIELFDYNNEFNPEFTEAKYAWTEKDGDSETSHSYDYVYGGGYSSTDPEVKIAKITSIESEFTPTISADTEYELKNNQIIQFRAPNFITEVTYPAYVNYYIKLKDGVASISNDSEYLLGNGEFLLINYTKSTTDPETDVTTKTVINKYYGKDTIIRPSGFSSALTDSHEYKNSVHSYSKTSGFDFTAQGITNPPGLFTLGTSEQIEIRKLAEITLDSASTNLYWELNSDATLPSGESSSIFSGDEDTYTLKDGEYLFYTDAEKLDFAYYGSGTVLKRGEKTPSISRTKTSIDMSSFADRITTEGLAAEIPWKSFNFSDTNAGLKICEYQYITLGAGSTVKVLSEPDSDSTPTALKYTYTGSNSYTVAGIGGSGADAISELIIADKYNNNFDGEHEVLKISPRAFQNRKNLESLVIPDTIKRIGNNAFDGCTNFKTVYYIGTVEEWATITIEEDNGKLTEATRYYYSESQPTASGNYWHYVNGVPSIWVLGDSTILDFELTTDAGGSTYYLVTGRDDSKIPQGATLIIPSEYNGKDVISIGYRAFEDCNSLTSVIIPDSVPSIDYDGVTSIGEEAFSGCVNLTSIEIPSSVTSIGNNAFLDCYRLVEVWNKSSSMTVSKGSTSNGYIGYYALAVFNSTDTYVNKFNNDNGYLMYNEGEDKSIYRYIETEVDLVLPLEATSIYKTAFADNSTIETVKISSNVTEIGDGAFKNCTKLTSATIPNSVESVGDSAFEDCTSLATIYYRGTKADWDNIEIASSASINNLNIIFTGPVTLFNEWQSVNTFAYNFAYSTPNAEGSQQLPTLSVEGISWEVKPTLLMNIGPDLSQSLYSDEKITINYKDDKGNPDTFEIETPGVAEAEPVTLRTNKVCYSTSGICYTDIAGASEEISNFLVKVFKEVPASHTDEQAGQARNEIISLQNYDTNTSTYTFTGKGDFIKLSCPLMEDTAGIFMIYVKAPVTSKGEPVAADLVKIKVTDGGTSITDSIADLNSSSDSEAPTKDGLTLSAGIHNIVLPSSCTVEITDIIDNGNLATRPTIAFSNLRLVNTGESSELKLNPKLGACFSGSAPVEQVCESIKELGTEALTKFYFCTPISNSMAIELNDFDDTQTLQSPQAFYDYNNKNNKFVISEIDADLTKGITIVKSSKR